jgi:DNA-binding cell septation regulator SpoVG
VEIKFLKKIDNGSRIKASFSVNWEGRLMIHDCLLIANGKGMFIKFPSRTYMVQGVKKYQPIVEVKNELLVKISELAVHKYGGLK